MSKNIGWRSFTEGNDDVGLRRKRGGDERLKRSWKEGKQLSQSRDRYTRDKYTRMNSPSERFKREAQVRSCGKVRRTYVPGRQ